MKVLAVMLSVCATGYGCFRVGMAYAAGTPVHEIAALTWVIIGIQLFVLSRRGA